jgi:hypothetical protein
MRAATRMGYAPSRDVPTQLLMQRRRALLGMLTTALGGSFSPVVGHGAELPPPHLRLIGDVTLPHRFSFDNTLVGGLSSIDYDPVDDLWYAISDDRSEHNPARFYTFRMDVSARGIGKPVFQSVVFFRQADGSTYPSRKQARNGQAGPVPDPEGLRWRALTRTLLWTSEGDPALGLAPFVREITPDGRHLREFPLPPYFATSPKGAHLGPRDNTGFEGLAVSPNGQQVWAAMEGPLHQDGPTPTLSAGGGACRITGFHAQTGVAFRQIAYSLDPVPFGPLVPGTFSDNGISEVLMRTDRLMWVLERSYSLGTGNSLRIYQIDVTDGSNTLTQAQFSPGNHQPVAKTLVANFQQLGLQRLDNTEGMAWGPSLPPTVGHTDPAPRRTLVCVSDDNFNPLQITQFVAFEVLA